MSPYLGSIYLEDRKTTTNKLLRVPDSIKRELRVHFFMKVFGLKQLLFFIEFLKLLLLRMTKLRMISSSIGIPSKTIIHVGLSHLLKKWNCSIFNPLIPGGNKKVTHMRELFVTTRYLRVKSCFLAYVRYLKWEITFMSN